MKALLIPHRVRVVALGCIDDRLVSSQARHLHRLGGGFLSAMAGGAAAILTERDQESALGQITDAYGVTPYLKVILRLHLGCGKLAGLCAEDGELHGQVDPTSSYDLYRFGDRAIEPVRAALRKAHNVEVPIEVEVYDIVPGRRRFWLFGRRLPTDRFVSRWEAK